MAGVRKRGKGWQIDYFDPHGKRVRKSFKKKKDAEAELGKRVSLIAERRYLDVKKEYKTTLKSCWQSTRKTISARPALKREKGIILKISGGILEKKPYLQILDM